MNRMKFVGQFGILALLVMVFASSVVFAAPKFKKEEIQFQSKDKFNLVGNLCTPAKSSIKNKPALIIMLHAQYNDSRKWGTLPDDLCSQGFAVLNMDLRGYGKSLVDRHGKKKYSDYFTAQTYKKFPKDVEAGISYLKDNYPEINTNKIGLLGAGLGASTAILTAYDMKEKVKTMVLINPFATDKNYGYDTRIPMTEFGNKPKMFITNPKNKIATAKANEIYKFAREKKVMKHYMSGMNTMDVIYQVPQSKSDIINWFKAYLK